MVEKIINKDLNNKIIIITGASSGLGFQIAKSLSKYNSKIIICSRNIKKIKSKFVLKKNVILKKVDVQKPNEVKKFINFVIKKYKRIDILINNAGIAKNVEIEKIDYKLIDKVFKTNLSAAFLFVKYSIPIMKKNNFGRIVNISSGGSINCAPGYSLYSASKAGLNTLAKSASNELINFNIKINTLSPGPVKTPMFPKNKLSVKLCIPTLKYLCTLKKNGPTGKFFWFMRQVKIIPTIKLNWGNPPNND